MPGLGQGHKGTNSNCKFSIVNFQLLVAWWLPEQLLNNITIDFNKIIDIDVEKPEWILFETEEAKT